MADASSFFSSHRLTFASQCRIWLRFYIENYEFARLNATALIHRVVGKPVSPRFLNQTNQVVIPTSTPHISHLLTLLLELSLPQVGLYLDCADDAQAQVPDLVLKTQAENAEMDLWTTQLGIWVADCHAFPSNGQTANGPQRSRRKKKWELITFRSEIPPSDHLSNPVPDALSSLQSLVNHLWFHLIFVNMSKSYEKIEKNI